MSRVVVVTCPRHLTPSRRAELMTNRATPRANSKRVAQLELNLLKFEINEPKAKDDDFDQHSE